MTDDQRTIALKQLANIVIDAYLDRDKRFIPDFGRYTSVIYLTRPEGDTDHPDLRTNVWYDRSDYECIGTIDVKKARSNRKN